jgi:DNA-binding MarR family transcriptional regulator
MSPHHLNRDESFGYLVNHLARLLVRALHNRISPHGVVPGQFPVLLTLWEHDGLTQAELHQRTDVEQATMANTLQRMERDGLVTRLPHPSDRRQAIVRLTQRARKLEPTLVEAARAINEMSLAGLSGTERAECLASLRRAIDNLRTLLDSGPVAKKSAASGRAPARRR